jgi:hypothetical protein
MGSECCSGEGGLQRNGRMQGKSARTSRVCRHSSLHTCQTFTSDFVLLQRLKQDASRNKGHSGSDRRESLPQVPMSTFCLRPSSLPPSILSSTDATSTNSKPCFQRRCARNPYQFSTCTSAANTCTDCIECNLGHAYALRPKLLKCASSWTRRNAMRF